MFVAFILFAVWITHPLLRDRATRIASDPGDPLLNASILWWNATVLPLTDHWWNPPYFYPTPGVTAFTEHLLGISVLATPTYWLIRDPIATYNLMVFVTWPLSAFAAYLLVYFLTRRVDAAVIAGLAWGFGPYRIGSIGHLQSMSAYWLPFALLGLHGYLRNGRRRWLVLFGVAWLCQALANNYYLVFTGLLIPIWVAYFCSTRATWRNAMAIGVAWVVASLPLVPIGLKYYAIHERFGLHRSLVEWRGFSIGLASWLDVPGPVWLSSLFGSGEANLYPGLSIVVVLLAGVGVWLVRARPSHQTGAIRIVRLVLAVLLVLSGGAALILLSVGPLRTTIGSHEIRMTDLSRVLYWVSVSAIGWVLLTPAVRAAVVRRSPVVFYVAATLLFAVLACGPLVMVGREPILNPAPYAYLLPLPGFDRLRVPSRIWMLGSLCLAVSAGLAYAVLPLTRLPWRRIVTAVVIASVVADGWIVEFPMYAIPHHWPKAERRDRTVPILELPLGPGWDAAATFRSMRHRRPVVNGVSGYDPPFYAPLQAGLESGDPQVVVALASLGELDVVVDGSEDKDGRWARYAASVPGATLLQNDGVRTVFRVTPTRSFDTRIGGVLPIAAVTVSHQPELERFAIDGRTDTYWENGPQRPGQWITADLGSVRQVGGVSHGLGAVARDFPRELAIDLSVDGASWHEVLTEKTAALAMLAAIRDPTTAVMRFSFAPEPARYVRLRQGARHVNLWRVVELQVHGPLNGVVQ